MIPWYIFDGRAFLVLVILAVIFVVFHIMRKGLPAPDHTEVSHEEPDWLDRLTQPGQTAQHDDKEN